jgi:hypothetical protein
MERATLFNDLAADPDRMSQLRKEALKDASRRRSGTPEPGVKNWRTTLALQKRLLILQAKR